MVGLLFGPWLIANIRYQSEEEDRQTRMKMDKTAVARENKRQRNRNFTTLITCMYM